MTDDDTHDDGGTATEATPLADGGVDETTIDPWGSSTIADYRKLFEEFGIEGLRRTSWCGPRPTLPDAPRCHLWAPRLRAGR